METNRDIGKVLLQLNDYYYEKGMRKISISLNGIRNEKISRLSRKVIIPKLINSKESEKFIKEFMSNLKEDLNILIEDESIKTIIDNPLINDDVEQLEETKKQLLYLYLTSLHNEKYESILHKLSSNILNEKPQKIESGTGINIKEKEILEYQTKCKSYEEKIEELKSISANRKEKLNQLEQKLNKITDEYNKLKKENNKLSEEIKDLKIQLQTYQNVPSIQNDFKYNEEICENKKRDKIIIVINDKNTMMLKNKDVIQMKPSEFLADDYDENDEFEKIYVYKKGIHIANLRKIKRLSGNKAIFFESMQEIINFIDTMEEKNGNGIK